MKNKVAWQLGTALASVRPHSCQGRNLSHTSTLVSLKSKSWGSVEETWELIPPQILS